MTRERGRPRSARGEEEGRSGLSWWRGREKGVFVVVIVVVAAAAAAAAAQETRGTKAVENEREKGARSAV